MPDLSELIARVEGLEGADREIGHALVMALALAPSGMEYCGPLSDGTHYWGGGGSTWGEPDYTASLDAALALVTRVLPGWLWNVSGPDELHGRKLCWAVVADKQDNGADEPWNVDRATYEAEAPTPALALILALLRALAVKEER